MVVFWLSIKGLCKFCYSYPVLAVIVIAALFSCHFVVLRGKNDDDWDRSEFIFKIDRKKTFKANTSIWSLHSICTGGSWQCQEGRRQGGVGKTFSILGFLKSENGIAVRRQMEIVNYLHITQDQIWRKLNISWYELLLVSLSRFDYVHYIWDPWYPL